MIGKMSTTSVNRPSVPTANEMESDIANAPADDPVFMLFSSEANAFGKTNVLDLPGQSSQMSKAQQKLPQQAQIHGSGRPNFLTYVRTLNH